MAKLTLEVLEGEFSVCRAPQTCTEALETCLTLSAQQEGKWMIFITFLHVYSQKTVSFPFH